MKMTKIFLKGLLISLSFLISSCGGNGTDIDGNSYRTLKIGNQKWMAENLNVSRFRNGDTIPEIKSAEEWRRYGEEKKPAFCIMENNTDYGVQYGKLYNWYAVNDPRGLAPKGWHIPSDEEWTELTDFLGGGVMAGRQMIIVGIGSNVNEDETLGFSGLPAGARRTDGIFYGLSSAGYWWTASEITASSSWMRLLTYVRTDVHSMSYDNSFGLSVRCVRD